MTRRMWGKTQLRLVFRKEIFLGDTAHKNARFTSFVSESSLLFYSLQAAGAKDLHRPLALGSTNYVRHCLLLCKTAFTFCSAGGEKKFMRISM